MDRVERKILDILNLPVTIKPINHWEGIQYKPYHKRMVDLEKVIEILEFKMDKNLHTNKELLEDFTDLTNRKLHQELFLFDLLDGDFDKLVLLEEKIHCNLLFYCPGDLEECEKVLAMETKWEGLRDFEPFKNL